MDLSPFVGGGKIIAKNVGQEGDLVLLTAAPDKAEIAFGRSDNKGGSFPNSRVEASYAATYFRFACKELIQQTELLKIKVAHPFIASLPDGEVLVVGARCYFKDEGPEKNAVVFDKSGNVLRHFVLGDGIQSVQTTSDGLIWVSYFDEGIFGNYGWDKPVGCSGLNCFDANGQLVWQFAPPPGLDRICDCYALNVMKEAVWLCYYTDFPLVKIGPDKSMVSWQNKVGGAGALAVYHDRVLLWGGYGDKRNRCVQQTIGSGSLTKQRELDLQLPAGLSLKGVQVLGRDSALHAITKNRWFTFSVENVV